MRGDDRSIAIIAIEFDFERSRPPAAPTGAVRSRRLHKRLK
jgi:hypothetical protein